MEQSNNYEMNSHGSFARNAPEYTNSLFNDNLYNIRTTLFNFEPSTRASLSTAAEDNEAYLDFQQWNVWKNSLTFQLSSSNNALNSSSSSEATSHDGVSVISEVEHSNGKKEITREEASISPDPGPATQITHRSSDNEKKNSIKGGKFCKFCKTNSEVAEVYFSHTLYEPKTRALMCPVLRKLICPTCGATGDRAHTLSYCPVRRANAYGEQPPLFAKIKKSCRLASGKVRF